MAKFREKLRSKKGESFVELLIAVLVVGFACLLIATMFGTAFTLNTDAKAKDDAYYGSITEMEQMQGSSTDKVQLAIEDQEGGSVSAEANRYGNDDFTAYRH